MERFPEGKSWQGSVFTASTCTAGRHSHKLNSGREGRGRTEGWVLVYQGILQTSFLLQNTLENTEPLLEIHTCKFLKHTPRGSRYYKIESVHRTLLSLSSAGVSVAEAEWFSPNTSNSSALNLLSLWDNGRRFFSASKGWLTIFIWNVY